MFMPLLVLHLWPHSLVHTFGVDSRAVRLLELLLRLTTCSVYQTLELIFSVLNQVERKQRDVGLHQSICLANFFEF